MWLRAYYWLSGICETASLIEENPETGEVTIYDPNNNVIDPADIPEDWQEYIVTDEFGKPVTDAAQLDLHIKEIGGDKYEILNLTLSHYEHFLTSNPFHP